jgi:high-affinity Fe2+/Pb2+ permease
LCVNARFLSTECTLLLLLAMVAVVVVRQREPASFSNSNVPLF